jgi:hypothetical protein
MAWWFSPFKNQDFQILNLIFYALRKNRTIIL